MGSRCYIVIGCEASGTRATMRMLIEALEMHGTKASAALLSELGIKPVKVLGFSDPNAKYYVGDA